MATSTARLKTPVVPRGNENALGGRRVRRLRSLSGSPRSDWHRPSPRPRRPTSRPKTKARHRRNWAEAESGRALTPRCRLRNRYPASPDGGSNLSNLRTSAFRDGSSPHPYATTPAETRRLSPGRRRALSRRTTWRSNAPGIRHLPAPGHRIPALGWAKKNPQYGRWMAGARLGLSAGDSLWSTPTSRATESNRPDESPQHLARVARQSRHCRTNQGQP